MLEEKAEISKWELQSRSSALPGHVGSWWSRDGTCWQRGSLEEGE